VKGGVRLVNFGNRLKTLRIKKSLLNNSSQTF